MDRETRMQAKQMIIEAGARYSTARLGTWIIDRETAVTKRVPEDQIFRRRRANGTAEHQRVAEQNRSPRSCEYN